MDEPNEPLNLGIIQLLMDFTIKYQEQLALDKPVEQLRYGADEEFNPIDAFVKKAISNVKSRQTFRID